MTLSINYKTSPSTKKISIPKFSPSPPYMPKVNYLIKTHLLLTKIKISLKKPNLNSFPSTKNPKLLTFFHPLLLNKEFKMGYSDKITKRLKESRKRKLRWNYLTVQVR